MGLLDDIQQYGLLGGGAGLLGINPAYGAMAGNAARGALAGTMAPPGVKGFWNRLSYGSQVGAQTKYEHDQQMLRQKLGYQQMAYSKAATAGQEIQNTAAQSMNDYLMGTSGGPTSPSVGRRPDLSPAVNGPAQPQVGSAPVAPVTQLGSVDNNVGNIRATPSSFRSYNSPEEGVAAAVNLLRSPTYANKSLRDVISTWAPPSENNTEGYIAAISKATGISQDMPLPTDDPNKMAAFVKEMTKIEKGKVAFPDSVFQAGATTAINGAPQPQQGQAPQQSQQGQLDMAGVSAMRQQLLAQAQWLMRAPNMEARIHGSTLYSEVLKADPGKLWDPTFQRQFNIPGGVTDPQQIMQGESAKSLGGFPVASALSVQGADQASRLSTQGFGQSSALSNQGFNQDVARVGVEAGLRPKLVRNADGSQVYTTDLAIANQAGTGSAAQGPLNLSPEQTTVSANLGADDKVIRDKAQAARVSDAEWNRISAAAANTTVGYWADPIATTRNIFAPILGESAAKGLSNYQDLQKLVVANSAMQTSAMGSREAAQVFNIIRNANPTASMSRQAITDIADGAHSINAYNMWYNDARAAYKAQNPSRSAEGFDQSPVLKSYTPLAFFAAHVTNPDIKMQLLDMMTPAELQATKDLYTQRQGQ